MAIKKQQVKVSELKGAKLYNYLLKTLGEVNNKFPKKQHLGNQSRRRIVKEVLFPRFKGGDIKVSDVKKQIKAIITALPPSEICNPLYLSESYLGAEEYYEIDNHIRTILPDCLEVRVNAGALGKTKIFNTSNYSYYSSGVKKIIENIREELAENTSGMAEFYGIVKVKGGRKNDGNPMNYFVDYILYINNATEIDDTPADYDLPKKEDKKKREITDYLSVKLKALQKEKRKRKVAKKKADPEFQKAQKYKALEKLLEVTKQIYQAKLISREEYQKRIKDYRNQIKSYKPSKKKP